jgi:hypothetical protein
MASKSIHIMFTNRQVEKLIPIMRELIASKPMTRSTMGQMYDSGDGAYFTLMTPEETAIVLKAIEWTQKSDGNPFDQLTAANARIAELEAEPPVIECMGDWEFVEYEAEPLWEQSKRVSVSMSKDDMTAIGRALEFQNTYHAPQAIHEVIDDYGDGVVTQVTL